VSELRDALERAASGAQVKSVDAEFLDDDVFWQATSQLSAGFWAAVARGADDEEIRAVLEEHPIESALLMAKFGNSSTRGD
jgi:hypothetical protein